MRKRSVGQVGKLVASSAVVVGVVIGGMAPADAHTSGTMTGVGPHSPSMGQCRQAQATNSPIAMPPFEVGAFAPTQKALNATAATDRQAVAWRPSLYRWNGSQWVFQSSGQWVYGFATDAASPSTWYGFDGGAGGSSQNFRVGSGAYAVYNQYYWYATSTAPAGSHGDWVSTYQSPIGAMEPGYCRLG